MLWTRRSGVLLAMFACSLTVAACGSSDSTTNKSGGADKSPVVLSLITFKVPGADELTPLDQGAQAAAKAINAKGGFGGRTLKLQTCNTMLQPATAVDCAHRTLPEKPVAMIGCEVVWTASGYPIYAGAGVPSINCLNSGKDFTSPLQFGITPGFIGVAYGTARWLCGDPKVKTVAAISPQSPSDIVDLQQAGAILKACGKQFGPIIQVPLSAVDMAPYVAKVVQAHPDFVLSAQNGANVVPTYKAFQQQGFAASKIAASDTDFTSTTTKGAGTAMDGTYALLQFGPLTATKDPQIAAFRQALSGSGADKLDPSVAWGYFLVMSVYQAAKQIGFDKFDAASLTTFLKTSRMSLPMARPMTNPGPKRFPQLKQPYVRIAQWKDGAFHVVPVGPHKDGWVSGM